MEIIELAHLRKAFTRTKDRYKHPHKEAMKLRLLWTYDKPPSKSRDSREAQSLYREIRKYAEDDEKLLDVWRMITKGLKLDPRFHGFYSIKGDINARRKKWTEAIKNFEDARAMAKYDRKLPVEQTKVLYNRQLIENYSQRGHWYYENGFLIEAASDYEQVIVLSPRNEAAIDIQDNLLDILRQLDKYDAFRSYWYQFTLHANEMRAATLLTLHAEYKIRLREIMAARQILLRALDRDKDNIRAQELLQIVYNTGRTMAMHTVMWCMHGCYEKALLTVEKARDCDPYNLGYILLKTIVLRLSGRLKEAASWLRNVDKDFRKYIARSRDTRELILGKLTVKQIREKFIEQWYRILYDMAMERMLSGAYEQAYDILQASVEDHRSEACVLLGDSLLLRRCLHAALVAYLRCRENFRHDRQSWRAVQLTKRILEILNRFAREAASRPGRSEEVVSISERALKILDEDEVDVSRLAVQRAEALSYKARGHLRLSRRQESREAAASSLRFARGFVDDGLYRALFADTSMEQVIDRFAPASDLPYALKILMQHT